MANQVCNHFECQSWHNCRHTLKEATHLDEGKVNLQYLLVFRGLDEVARVGEFGAKKYGQFNYMGGSSYMRFLGSCARHLAAFIRGEDVDKESGCSHLAHLVFDCLMVLEWMNRGVGTDDRYKDLSKSSDNSLPF